jgi:ABC-type lipopolysaccharide export system ATPase subunit
MLQVLDLVTGYDKQQVLQGLTLRVHPGEIAGMVGPNGAGSQRH